MILLFLQTYRLFRVVAGVLVTPEGRGVTALLLIQLVGGTMCYQWIEGWSAVDALYFCVATLTTVGYGDLTPATDLGKLFTVGYITTGIGLFVSFATLIAQRLVTNAAAAAPQEATGAQ